jgi:RHS repeat-associated protein
MEKDPEVKGEGNSYTTEFRQYDPRLGRWLSLDPLMAQFPWMSPYCAFDNNPVLYVDPYGLASTNGNEGEEEPLKTESGSECDDGSGGNFVKDLSQSNSAGEEEGRMFPKSGLGDGDPPVKSSALYRDDNGKPSVFNNESLGNSPFEYFPKKFGTADYDLSSGVLSNEKNYTLVKEIGAELLPNPFNQTPNYLGPESCQSAGFLDWVPDLLGGGLEEAGMSHAAAENTVAAASLGMFLFGGKISTSSLAKSWQGKGAYLGVDIWKDITLKEGKYVVGGIPGQSEFYTTINGLNRSNLSKSALGQGLQIQPNPVHGYRGSVCIYKVTKSTSAAFGTTYANPQFGNGGLPQLFIPNYQNVLTPVMTIPLK